MVPIITDVYRLRGVSTSVVFIEVPVTSMMITLRNSRQNLQISLILYAATLKLDVGIVFLQYPYKLHDFLPISLKSSQGWNCMASRFGGAVTRWIADPFYLGANPKAGSTSFR